MKSAASNRRRKAAAKPLSGGAEGRIYDRLCNAAAAYIRAHDGVPLVAGGVSVIQMPGDPELSYYLAVRITGSKPQFKEPVKVGENRRGK